MRKHVPIPLSVRGLDLLLCALGIVIFTGKPPAQRTSFLAILRSDIDRHNVVKAHRSASL